ncbi:hypothetical protein [Kibdelosporangium philippinense]|uniref:hypothetical protein n=1 Tax=Kibdelosporangium philippinense TaxID=211113 RepID=UPI00361BDE35
MPGRINSQRCSRALQRVVQAIVRVLQCFDELLRVGQIDAVAAAKVKSGCHPVPPLYTQRDRLPTAE